MECAKNTPRPDAGSRSTRDTIAARRVGCDRRRWPPATFDTPVRRVCDNRPGPSFSSIGRLGDQEQATAVLSRCPPRGQQSRALTCYAYRCRTSWKRRPDSPECYGWRQARPIESDLIPRNPAVVARGDAKRRAQLSAVTPNAPVCHRSPIRRRVSFEVQTRIISRILAWHPPLRPDSRALPRAAPASTQKSPQLPPTGSARRGAFESAAFGLSTASSPLRLRIQRQPARACSRQ